MIIQETKFELQLNEMLSPQKNFSHFISRPALQKITLLWLLCFEWVEEMGKGGQKVQTFNYKINKLWDVRYSLVDIVNNAVLYISKLLRE